MLPFYGSLEVPCENVNLATIPRGNIPSIAAVKLLELYDQRDDATSDGGLRSRG
jgi:hypothetical protein